MSTVAPSPGHPGRDRVVADTASGAGLFHATVSLGRVQGVAIGLSWSWLLILGLMVWSLAGSVFPAQNPGLSDATYLAMGSAAVALFFVCLVAMNSDTRGAPDSHSPGRSSRWHSPRRP